MTPGIVNILRELSRGPIRLSGSPTDCPAVTAGYAAAQRSGEGYEYVLTLTQAGREALKGEVGK